MLRQTSYREMNRKKDQPLKPASSDRSGRCAEWGEQTMIEEGNPGLQQNRDEYLNDEVHWLCSGPAQ
jgi:hypothetical protein